jgi:hypothetical protein
LIRGFLMRSSYQHHPPAPSLRLPGGGTAFATQPHDLSSSREKERKRKELEAMRAEWGARLACLAIVSRGVRDHDRLAIAAGRITGLSGTDAAWWVGLLTGPGAERAARALRILTEAVA